MHNCHRRVEADRDLYIGSPDASGNGNKVLYKLLFVYLLSSELGLFLLGPLEISKSGAKKTKKKKMKAH